MRVCVFVSEWACMCACCTAVELVVKVGGACIYVCVSEWACMCACYTAESWW